MPLPILGSTYFNFQNMTMTKKQGPSLPVGGRQNATESKGLFVSRK